MSLAYTPGLKRKEFVVLRKTRKLPIPGKVLVKKGENVSYDTIVATTLLQGPLETVNLPYILGVEPEIDEAKGIYRCDVRKFLVKKEGDTVSKGELIAIRKHFFGLFKKVVTSPIDGIIEFISDTSGQLMIRHKPVPLNVYAYIPGLVVDVLPNAGVIIQTAATFIQGIFGIGGETHGELAVLVDKPDDFLTADMIDKDCEGKIIVGGSGTDSATIKKALTVGVKGIITGGLSAKDCKDILGQEIGVAITGRETIGLTLILTEGFRRMKMAEKTFNLLRKHEGKLACINGATQIRAGVIRPEIIIPLTDAKRDMPPEKDNVPIEGLKPGLLVRIIQTPYFGEIGHITQLPCDLQKLVTESYVRVLEVELEDGRRVIVPRANVELIEE